MTDIVDRLRSISSSSRAVGGNKALVGLPVDLVDEVVLEIEKLRALVNVDLTPTQQRIEDAFQKLSHLEIELRGVIVKITQLADESEP